jgi:aspartate-semialdehyde dehydrogenase
MSKPKLKVGVLGATGMVGQRFVSLLANHPWFEVTVVAASPSSAGKSYADAVAGRWSLAEPTPAAAAALTVVDAADVAGVAGAVDFVFCAVDMAKDATAKLEDDYARAETPVVSNNSAHRATPDVPMMIPEINADHAAVIAAQRRRHGVSRGFVAVKPNCSLQSYVPAIHPLKAFGPNRIAVCTYQAISGAGKTFASWPEMVDNVIPFIKGEEEKSEQEPLKIWGQHRSTARSCRPRRRRSPRSASGCRCPTATWRRCSSASTRSRDGRDPRGVARVPPARRRSSKLPSAPTPFLTYFEDDNRPQTRLDRDAGGGQAVTIGRLRPDALFDWRFVALSHNTVRGAAGGAVLTAELLAADGYLPLSRRRRGPGGAGPRSRAGARGCG